MSISMMLGVWASSGSSDWTLSIFFFKSVYALSMSVPYSYSRRTMDTFSLDMEVVFLIPFKIPT